jgi:hypothetical protein
MASAVLSKSVALEAAMKRCLPLAVVLPTVMLLAQTASAQCSKQVLAYLDASGSMLPKRLDAGSPFAQVVGALRQLLERRNLIDAGDDVKFFRFGDRVSPAGQGASGAKQLTPTEAELGNHFAHTDIGCVFADLPNSLSSSASFTRQVVIVASDFAHDPRRASGSFSRRMADWNHIAPEVHQQIVNFFSARGTGELVLLVAPAEGEDLAVQRQVLGDLKAIPDIHIEDLDLGATTASQEQLAGRLLRALFLKPEVKLFGAPAGREGAVRLSNPNCTDLTLTYFQISCANGAGTRGSYKILEAPATRSLPPGSPTYLPIPAEPLASCSQDAPHLKAAYKTAQRGDDVAEGDMDHLKIAFAPENVISEWNLLRQRLHVLLKLQGYIPANGHLMLSVLDHDRVLASARLLPNNPLPLEDPRLYRADLNAGWFPSSDHNWDLKVKIDDADQPTTKPVKFESWDRATCANVFSMVAGAAMIAFYFVPLLFRPQQGGARGPDADAVVRFLKQWAGPSALVLIPFVVQWFLPSTYLFRPISFTLMWLVTSLTLGLFTGLLRSAVLVRRQGRKGLRAVKERGDLSAETLRAHMTAARQISRQRGSATVWGALVALAVFALGLGLLRSGPLDLSPEYQSAEVLTTWSD